MAVRYVVSPRGGWRTYADIGSAVAEAARRGRSARIEIEPGHYEVRAPLVVGGEVELVARGEPGSVVVSAPGGTVLDAGGAVRVRGLVIEGRDGDVVRCGAGTLTVEQGEIRAPQAVAVHAVRGTAVTLRDTVVRQGRLVFAGAGGLVERCGLYDAADNALAVVEGARVTVRDSRFAGARFHGIRVRGAHVECVGCEFTGSGSAALFADTQAWLAVADCTIADAGAEGIGFIEQSRGTVDGVRVTGSEHGIAVGDGSDPVVRGCVFTGCRDTGINVRAGRGRFEECEVAEAGNIAVFVLGGGRPEVHGLRVVHGNVGVVVEGTGSRGRFTRVRVADLTSVALRAYEGGKAVFQDVRVERCPTHLETRGDPGTTAEVEGGVFEDFSMSAVEVLGQSRVTLRHVTAERGAVGFGVAKQGQLFITECDVRGADSGGAAALGKGRLVARGLRVDGSAASGLFGQDNARVDVSESEFADCELAGVFLRGEVGGRLVGCTVSGTRGVGVWHNGLVSLVALESSLPVKEWVEKENPAPPTHVTYNNHVTVHGGVRDAQIAVGNERVEMNQSVSPRHTDEDGSSA
ncbi:right-handed parallel beta-helix repeat-containing protein [Streptomyces sp. NPDC048623]|uniref:right-handed parallel beta-helix repeat-containing protein n=1 Tax=Streptomyces sp. NPDC048623 TaxID=3155761 RepID=UPI003420668E